MIHVLGVTAVGKPEVARRIPSLTLFLTLFQTVFFDKFSGFLIYGLFS